MLLWNIVKNNTNFDISTKRIKNNFKTAKIKAILVLFKCMCTLHVIYFFNRPIHVQYELDIIRPHLDSNQHHVP